jgi:hypothetical protein
MIFSLPGICRGGTPTENFINLTPGSFLGTDPVNNASHAIYNYDASACGNLIDGDLNTYKQGDGAFLISLAAASTVHTLKLARSSNVSGNVWWEGADAGTWDVTLEGTNDFYGTWDTLVSVSAQLFAVGTLTDLVVDPLGGPYILYRLTITNVSLNNSRIGEVQFWGTTP